MSEILITGGSGLVGKYLTSILLEDGHRVTHLSRNVSHPGKVRVVRWDPERLVLDPQALEGIDCIIHLAGADIGEKRWNSKRKNEIVRSRVDSAKLLYRLVSENKLPVSTYITASAIGYYGSVTSDRIYTEDDPPSNDFLGNTCRLWEEAADQFQAIGIRTVKIRTAVVIEKNDSALSKFLDSAKFGIFPRIGSGKQYFPWIHINDLCRIYLRAVNDSNMKGAFNAVSPEHTTNISFTRTLASVMGKPYISIPVPGSALRLLMGKGATVALEGSRISCGKILLTGYRFNYPLLEEALRSALL